MLASRKLSRVKFGKMFGRSDPPKPDDPFGLAPLCESLGLGPQAAAILAACRPSVAIDVAESRTDLPHTSSYLGGYPALPDRFEWPRDEQGNPLRFLGQLACSELALAKLSGLPDEGLLSIFLDALDDEPTIVEVHHFSLQRDLLRRPAPNTVAPEVAAWRPSFHTIASLPRPGSLEYGELQLSGDAEDAYYQLLIEVEESLEPCELRCGGHPPFSEEDGCYPEQGGGNEWDFFLAVRDIEQLGVVWPETACAMLWIPKRPSERFLRGRAELTWQTVDDEWEEEEDEDEEPEEGQEIEEEED